jgi:cellulose biosynthesis protein BcsQ
MSDSLLSSGQIITFYSYKGGTGRSMALANVACLLARESIKENTSPRVLMIDWDLEAPGLHRFFQNKIGGRKGGNKQIDFQSQPGLIDLFYKMREKCENIGNEISDDFFDSLGLDKYISETEVPSLYLMTAGKFDDNYSTRANSFDWANLFETCPSLLLRFSEYLSKQFGYVLVDSRTGYTDISGICTTLIPEKLVLVFTPNRQSLTGIIDLVRKATEYRKQSDDLRKLVIFPLPSRIEPAEPNLRKDWRFGNHNKDIHGYQPEFESVFKDVYHLKECDLTRYFDDVQIQQIPRYAYGEDVAVLSERTEDRLSIARSYEDFAQRLTLFEGPWDYPKESANIGGVVGDQGSIIIGDENIVPNRVEEKGLLRVFLAHSSFDKPFVRDLYQKLKSEDWIDPWLDEDKLLPGQDWSREISKAVRESDVLLVCLSEKSVEKEGYIQRELKYALDATLEKPEGTIFIIPIRLDNCKVPSRLMSYHWLDYFPEKERAKSYQRLLNSLQLRATQLGKDKQQTNDDLLRRVREELDAEGEDRTQILNKSTRVMRILANRIAQRLKVSVEQVIDALQVLGGKT